MTAKERLKKIAAAFLVESQSDYKAVSILIKNKQYNSPYIMPSSLLKNFLKPVWLQIDDAKKVKRQMDAASKILKRLLKGKHGIKLK